MIELLLKVLGFLFKLLVLAITGEWPASEPDAPEPQPAKRARAPRRVPPAPQGRFSNPELEGGAMPTRTPESRALADAETCLQALAEPIVEHLRASSSDLPPLRFVAVAEGGDVRADSAGESEAIRVRVGASFASTPERWVFLGRQVGRTLFDVVPGWSAEVYAAHRLPPSLFMPPGHGVYDADTARAAIGVWLPEVFADVVATYMLGPGYAAALGAGLAKPRQPIETCLARGQGRWLAPSAPSVLRIHAVLRVLSQLGQHDWERVLRGRWEASHGNSESLYLPLADGRLMAIPLDFMRGELDAVLDWLLEEPQVALGGQTWLDVPGFAYLHGEHAQVESAVASLARGEAVDLSPRLVLAAAALASDGNAGSRSLIAGALAGSIRGADTLEAAPNAFTLPGAMGAPGARSLGAALRDPHAVREALLLGSMLTPVRRKSSRS